MPSTNFLVWNPNVANQESDSTYSADAQRTGGAATNAIFASVLANKLFYQVSIFCAAMATMLVGKGYSPNDGNLAPSTALGNLVAVLANILTQADVPTLFTSPAFTGIPTAPTAAPGTNTTQIATTAFVTAGGFPKGPNLRVQGGGGSGGSVTFPVAFSAPPGLSITEFGGSVNLSTLTATGFSYNFSGSSAISWVAVGPA